MVGERYLKNVSAALNGADYPDDFRIRSPKASEGWIIGGLGLGLVGIAAFATAAIFSGSNESTSVVPEPEPTVQIGPSVEPSETADPDDEYTPWVEPTPSKSTTQEPTPKPSPSTSSTPSASATSPSPKPTPTKTTMKPVQYGTGITIIDFSQASEEFSSAREAQQVAGGIIDALGEAGVRVVYGAEELRNIGGRAGYVFSIGPSNEDEPSIRYRNEGSAQTSEKACIEQGAAQVALQALQPTDADQIYLRGVPAYRTDGTPLRTLPGHTLWTGIDVENLPEPEVETAIAAAIQAVRSNTDSLVASCRP